MRRFSKLPGDAQIELKARLQKHALAFQRSVAQTLQEGKAPPNGLEKDKSTYIGSTFEVGAK